MLHFEREMQSAATEIEAAAYNVPEGFSDRIMLAIEEADETAGQPGNIPKGLENVPERGRDNGGSG